MMPVWTPGFYRADDYAGKVAQFTARTPDGRPLTAVKSSANHWQVQTGNALSGTVTYSENEVEGGPFAFARVGAVKLKSFAWRVNTKSRGAELSGSGRVSVDPNGKVLGSGGVLHAVVGSVSWNLTVDPPGVLKRGKTGAFTLTLAAHITKATCDDADGKLIVTKGHATLTGLCGQPEVLTKGTATLK